MSEKFESRSEGEAKREIKDATSLDELCEILLEKGEVVGSKRSFSAAEELVPAIQKLKEAADEFADTIDALHQQTALEKVEGLRRVFTRSEGLRDKVEDLFKKYIEELAIKKASEMLKFDPEEPNAEK